MEKTKTPEEGQEKMPPVVVVEKHVVPEKKDGPQAAGKAPATGAQETPAHVMPAAERREGVAEQARQMADMQRRVGNTRLARLLTGQGQAAEQTEKQKEKEETERQHT